MRLTSPGWLVPMALGLTLLVACGGAKAEEDFKWVHSELRQQLNALENVADALKGDYKKSLRLARRWLPRGDELDLWVEFGRFEKDLNKLENAFGNLEAEDLERELFFFLRNAKRTRSMMAQIPTAKKVQRRWALVEEHLEPLRAELTMLQHRNRVHADLDIPRWDIERLKELEPGSFFTRQEKDKVKHAITQAEDLTNRLKQRVRPEGARHYLASRASGNLAELDEVDVIEAVYALERHVDNLAVAHARRGSATMKPELHAPLFWTERVGEMIHWGVVSEDARRDFRELEPHMRLLARLYRLNGKARPRR